jgi:thiol-disulfide isomerase/thioredoxin
MRIISTILFTIITFSSIAQSEISIKLHNYRLKPIFIGYFQDGKTLSIDTLKTDENSTAIFKSTKKLHAGNYFFFTSSDIFKDFLIGKNQNFNLSSENKDNKIFSTSDTNNQVYFGYQKFIINQKTNLQQRIKDGEDINELKKSTFKSIEEYKTGIINNYKGYLVSRFFKAQNQKHIVEDEDKDLVYERYIAHYWDNYNFIDSSYIRTKFFKKELDFLFEEILYQKPSFLANQVDRLLVNSKSKSLKDYLTKYFYNKYSKTSIMGLDSLFVHIAENYVLQPDVNFVNDEFKENLRKRIEAIKPNLVGYKAKDLKNTISYDGESVDLYSINAKFLVMVFWNTNCGYCKEEIPKLYKVTKELENKYGAKVFSFYTHDNEKQWKEFIEDEEIFEWINVYDKYNTTDFRKKFNVYKTPIVYILDQDKKIIAKNIAINQIEQVIKSCN